MNLSNNTLLQGGKYRIVRFINAGGFGCTYEAITVATGRTVAIKELYVKDISERDEQTLTINAYSRNKSALLTKIKKKFLEEANALRQMNHPNIVRVYDSFEENGTAYYVMDYINGFSLQEIIKRKGRLPEQESLNYIQQIAKALDYVHRMNRLHLDIKPGNIMIDIHGNAILIDFGVSKQYDEVNGESTSTMIGKALGYSPIEQLGNDVYHFSPATDIYALGATLYKCVTGMTPPNATTILSDGMPQMPNDLSATTINAIKSAMKPDKKDRPQNIAIFMSIFNTQPAKIIPRSNNGIAYGVIGGIIAVVVYCVLFWICVGIYNALFVDESTAVSQMIISQYIIAACIALVTCAYCGMDDEKGNLGCLTFGGIFLIGGIMQASDHTSIVPGLSLLLLVFVWGFRKFYYK